MLKFDVTNQTLKRVDRFDPATDSVDYLHATFNFLTADWEDKAKHAIFRVGEERYKAVINGAGVCKVPHEVLARSTEGYMQGARANKFFVTVVGIRNTVTLPTNEIRVDLNTSGNGEAENEQEPTADIFAQVVTAVMEDNEETERAVEELTTRAESAADDATAARTEIRNYYSNAIKGEASGEIIRVDDVSPLEHVVKTWVHGKNIWNSNLEFPINNIEYDPETQIYTFNGPTNTTLYTLPVPIPKGTTCTIKALVISGNVTSGGDGGLCFGGYNKSDGGNSWQTSINIPKCENADISGLEFVETMTVTKPVTDFFAFIYASTAAINEPLKVKIQFEISGTPTEWEPFIDPRTITVLRSGKNLLDSSLMKTTETNSGVTVTRSGDVIALNGTATQAAVLFNTMFCKNGGAGNWYTLAYKYISGTIEGVATVCVGESASPNEARGSWGNVKMSRGNNSYAYQLAKPYIKDVWFYCEAGTVFNNFKIKLQLEAGETATAYEAHKGASYTPDENGECDVISVSPIMTVTTGTAGTVVDVEYNKDINCVADTFNAILENLLNGGV